MVQQRKRNRGAKILLLSDIVLIQIMISATLSWLDGEDPDMLCLKLVIISCYHLFRKKIKLLQLKVSPMGFEMRKMHLFHLMAYRPLGKTLVSRFPVELYSGISCLWNECQWTRMYFTFMITIDKTITYQMVKENYMCLRTLYQR